MKKIYVGNLSYKATEDEVRDTFAEFGAIEQVALIRDRATNQPKGFGFVTFESADAAQAALAKNGQDLLGRSMKVSIAKEKEDSEGGRRSGGGGGRGGFGGGGGSRGGFGGGGNSRGGW